MIISIQKDLKSVPRALMKWLPWHASFCGRFKIHFFVCLQCRWKCVFLWCDTSESNVTQRNHSYPSWHTFEALNIFACWWWYSKRWLKLKRLRVLFNYINNLLYSLYHPCFVYYRSHTNSPIKQTNFPPYCHHFEASTYLFAMYIIKVWSPIPRRNGFWQRGAYYTRCWWYTIFVRILPKNFVYYFIYLYVMNFR